ncbi:protein-S-isoprenylcysteine O-methyltransferase Ste14 [Planifilum fimeticola]|uniref:Protein-S-isoprenylcysteine O-methyltransferase Ste14 n=1 Tax=Planifilum fimeticola TaxID=201975 RepID=A0A2T0LBI0_9BACL|nr:protein-S-isoprenylcysteine O-methyltransferase [Planifilum fimeticola]PRX39265.1 protein-S-isoprenylcysteine O-methyltransferase Ste14 [Planifilum fimeticola]
MFQIAAYFLGLIVMQMIRRPYERRVKSNRIVVARKTALEKFLLAQMAVGIVFIPLIYAFTSLLDFADYRLPSWTTWLGIGVSAAALWFFWRSHADLGRNWSPTLELREEHELITHGVYQYVRHPMYAAGMLWGAVQGLILHNWIAGWSPFLSLLILYFLRVSREEQMMLDQFGEAYQAYRQRTGRIFPRWRRS